MPKFYLFTDDFGNSNTAGLDDFFWCAHIRRLVNLTELNLNLIATDEILILVGNYCAKLEVVNIVSRIKQDYVQQHTDGDGLPNPNPAIFPAISLRFCVSDVGLASLIKCKCLRKVVIQNTNNMAMQNRGITLTGVRSLVKSLPNLEVMAFGSLGKYLYLFRAFIANFVNSVELCQFCRISSILSNFVNSVEYC